MPYLGSSGDVPGANIKSYRYKQGTDTSTGATSFPAVNKGADELRVYLNGALLKLTADYTFTTSAVTISPAPADDDEIQIDVYTSMNLADTVSSSDGGNFVGAVTFQAGVKTGSVKAQDGTSAITIADSTGKVTIPGDLEIQGTTTTIDTNVESVDKLEVGANSSDYAVSITQSGAGVGLDINGSELVLDADADTSIHASTDDQIDIKVGGTDKVTIDSTALKTDDIQEKSADHGVEIDGVTLKDGSVATSANLDSGVGADIGNAHANGYGVKIRGASDSTRYALTVNNNADNPLMRVMGNGNVGIGTDAPATQASADTFLEIKKASGIAGLGLNGGGASRFELISDTGDDFKILRNGSEKFKIDGSTGSVTITDGDLVIAGGTGKGIDFTTGNPALINSAGSSGQVLDSYEQGSWTITNTAGGGGTAVLSNYTGYYTRIGNHVFCTGYLRVHTSAGSSATFGGLPFNSANHEGARGGGSAGYNSELSTPLNIRVALNGSEFLFYSGSTYEDFSGGKEAFFSLHYIAEL